MQDGGISCISAVLSRWDWAPWQTLSSPEAAAVSAAALYTESSSSWEGEHSHLHYLN